MVKFCETPVYKPKLITSPGRQEQRVGIGGRVMTYFAVLVVYHDIVGLHIPVHDAFRVAEIEGLEHTITEVKG